MRHEAVLYEKLAEKAVRCLLCSHNCIIQPDKYGICNIRQNVNGKLYTHVYGRVIAAHIDPIEKKPFYHLLPGTKSFSIATPGCNFKCDFCQNWQISQVKNIESIQPGAIPPEKVVKEALDSACRSIAYTYTEPTVFFEYAYDIMRMARKKGLLNLFVTNGFMTRQAIDTVSSCLDAANIDLKSFKDDFYRQICKARLGPVLDSIRYMKERNIWIEITTLVVPGLNDSKKELADIASFIAQTGADIPWHISRFHTDYMSTGIKPTPVETLFMARSIGREAGLRYVYLGNVAQERDTLCCKCKKTLIKRSCLSAEVTGIGDNRCIYCNTPVAGVFS